VHEYQTLVREIATPNISAFVGATLQLIKSPAAGARSNVPLRVAELIASSLSALIPLYPTTLRPSNTQIRSLFKQYLVPTLSDDIAVPQELQHRSRRLIITLHFTAAKNNGSDDWSKLVNDLMADFHTTADQVFRAVQESWENSTGRSQPRVDLSGPPQGGGTGPDELPRWEGIWAGSDRLVGLLNFMADSLRYPTKAAVSIPVGPLTDIISRVTLISLASGKSHAWEQGLEINPAVGREEKDELWAVMPEIHIAALQLAYILCKRLERNIMPITPEIVDNLVRVFKSGIQIPKVRGAGYALLGELILHCGPTMSKPMVETLDPIIASCCRDLQQDVGLLDIPKPANKAATETKKNGTIANADQFLHQKSSNSTTSSNFLESHHRSAAQELLPAFLSHLPQKHLKPSLRGLIDQTVIVTSNKSAMIASVLNPYKDQRDRMYPSIIPYLAQRYPHDQTVEVLRTNIRTAAQSTGDAVSFAAGVEEPQTEVEDEVMSQEEIPSENTRPELSAPTNPTEPAQLPAAAKAFESPFLPRQTVEIPDSNGLANELPVTSPLKRKGSDIGVISPKRQELIRETIVPQFESQSTASVEKKDERDEDENSDDDDSDESVHLNMELDDDDEDDEEE
jgi:pre-rRNA-processing protein RIX1